jgi:hypothetical protein
MTDLLTRVLVGGDNAQLRVAEVVEITESGTVVVTGDGSNPEALRCDMLVTTDAPPPALTSGDRVLVWVGPNARAAVVLGRIGPSRGLTPDAAAVPDTLTIEAKQSLTIRVGEGSITIREDGKILIRGKDLVSHAQRTNRIKGGAVAIN